MLLNLKLNRWLRGISLLLIGVTLLLFILASTRDLGTYIFHKGTSGNSDIIDKIKVYKPNAKNPLVNELSGFKYQFNAKSHEPLLGNLLWGDQSVIKFGLGLSMGAFIGAIAQIAKLFNKKYVNKNFVNSIVIIIALIVALGFAGHIAMVITLVLAIGVQSILLTSSVLVEKKGQVMA